jgi:signal transduction histidine kinase
MKRAPGSVPAGRDAGEPSRPAGAALARVLAGPDAAPGWGHPPWPRRSLVALSLATLALCLVNLASLRGQAAGPGRLPVSPEQVLLAVTAVAPLLLAVRYPLLGWRIAWLALLLGPLVPGAWWGGWPWGPAQLVAAALLFCSAGVRYPRPVLWWMWALSLIPWTLWLVTDIPDRNGPLGATIAVTVGTVALDSLRARWGTERALVAQTRRTELEQGRRAVLEERARIARELHDVVAHHMSLIAVRAESAPYRLAELPAPVHAEFLSLSAEARQALAEMRRLLGVLRHDEPPELGPQPRLADLPALIDAVRVAGVPVELSAPAGLDQVPAGVGVCAYRIVQESLSNAGRHAPGAAVSVLVERRAGAVLLRVVNGPGELAGPPGGGPGHGLLGMRERVALLGGSLSADPAADGGFVVAAVLPLGPAA